MNHIEEIISDLPENIDKKEIETKIIDVLKTYGLSLSQTKCLFLNVLREIETKNLITL